MTRTHDKVSDAPRGAYREPATPEAAAEAVERALAVLEGRWKLVNLFQLFGGRVLRFSELERAIPGISQKMLGQQLKQLEQDGMVARTVHPEVPPRVEYRLTPWGQAACPVLDQLLRWAAARGDAIAAEAAIE